MRLLASAFSCCPGHGSEPGVGWNTVEQLSKEHEVWVLVHEGWRGRVEAAFDQCQHPNLHFEFVGIPVLSALAERLPGSGAVWWLYYYLWQFAALLHAWRLHQRIGFDVCQHVTFVKYNTPSLLHLLGIPFIFGPVGGAERAPLSFFKEFGWKTWLMEAARVGLIKVARFDPLLRWCVHRSSLCLGVTEDTAAELRKLGAKRVEVLPAVALADAEIAQIQTAKGEGQRAKDEPLTLLYVGRLIAWKGVHLGLRALAQCEDKTLRYHIIGDGPLRVWLEAEAQRLGIANRVEFCGALPRDQVLQAYAQADGFLYPSLHDSGGNAVIEAMCAGLPILCLDCGGPGWIVSEECGWKPGVGLPDEVVVFLAASLKIFAADAGEREARGQSAQHRCLDQFAWSQRKKNLTEFIREVV
jgi:glycosyltransferase involved in cell wall biosynthesis